MNAVIFPEIVEVDWLDEESVVVSLREKEDTSQHVNVHLTREVLQDLVNACESALSRGYVPEEES